MWKWEVRSVGLFVFLLFAILSKLDYIEGVVEVDDDLPRFLEPIKNMTVVVGRDVILSCSVENLNHYKVGWVFLETRNILTIGHYVITRDPRFSATHEDHTHWNLRISNVRPSDRGFYICQVNTDPMMSSFGFLDVQELPEDLGTKANNTSETDEHFEDSGTEANSTSEIERHFEDSGTEANSTSEIARHFEDSGTEANSTSEIETRTCPVSGLRESGEGLVNIAFDKKAFGSAVFQERYNSLKAIDCDNSTWYHSLSGLKHPWWNVDLGDKYLIRLIRILPGQHSVYHRRRFKDITIRVGIVSPIDRNLIGYKEVGFYEGPYSQYEGWVEYRLSTPMKGRYVDIARTTLTDDDYVILAEVEVLVDKSDADSKDLGKNCPIFGFDSYYDDLVNVAYGKKTTASTTYKDLNKPHLAVDCDTVTYYHSARGGHYPSWSVDLRGKHLIHAIRILPGPYSLYNMRSLSDIKISVGMMTPDEKSIDGYTTVTQYEGPYDESEGWLEFYLPMEVRGRYVDIRRTTLTDNDYLIFSEVEVLANISEASSINIDSRICPIFSLDDQHDEFVNVAFGKITLGTPTHEGRNKHHQAVDCDTSTWYHSEEVDYPWWAVALGSTYMIETIRILPGQHSSIHMQRFKNIKIRVGMESPEDRRLEGYQTVGHFVGPYTKSQEWLEFTISPAVRGRYVDISKISMTEENYIILSEVEVLVNLQNNISTPIHPTHQSMAECRTPFRIIPEVGCLYLPGGAGPWQDGRSLCELIGSDIFVANSSEHFWALHNYLLEIRPRGSDIWVGVQSKSWLNGRVSAEEEWKPATYHNNRGPCGYMEAWSNDGHPTYLLWEYVCNGSGRPLCLKDI